jgi:hypothetical protein
MINKVQIRKIKAPGYKTRMWIVVSNSFLKSVDAVEDRIDHKMFTEAEKRGTRCILAYTYAYEKATGGYHILIFLKPTAKPGVIAHECKHAVNFIFKWHGQKLSLDNDEHECYLLDWMVDQAHYSIKKFRGKK